MNAVVVVTQSLHKAVDVFQTREQELGRLDAAAGDGDHGATMLRGLRAADAAVGGADPQSAGDLLVQAGEAFADAAGGASGALFGAFFTAAGRKLSTGDESAAGVREALRAGLALVVKLGKAVEGDRTLIDALSPFVAAFDAAVAGGEGAASAWHVALPAAEKGAAATAAMVARRGRAARLGERSRGGVDPGAQSVVYLLSAVDAVLQESCAANSSIL